MKIFPNFFLSHLGIIFWRMLSRSNNYKFNAFAMGLVGMQLANIVCSQSSYFIKDFLYGVYYGFCIIFSHDGL
jgi:hypothetical protein